MITRTLGYRLATTCLFLVVLLFPLPCSPAGGSPPPDVDVLRAVDRTARMLDRVERLPNFSDFGAGALALGALRQRLDLLRTEALAPVAPSDARDERILSALTEIVDGARRVAREAALRGRGRRPERVPGNHGYAAGELAGAIAGTVFSSAGVPIEGASIDVYDAHRESVMFAHTDAGGSYATPLALPPGSYWVVSRSDGYLGQLFEGEECGLYCDLLAGTEVVVTDGNTTGGVDFVLEPGGRIGGTVTHRASGEPIPEACVSYYNEEGRRMGTAGVGDDGEFLSWEGLPGGLYYALGWDCTQYHPQYIAEFLGGAICFWNDCDPLWGEPIRVHQGEETRIDIQLDLGGSITGRVVSAVDEAPLEGGRVEVFNTEGIQVATGRVNHDGWFKTDLGLASGSYYLRSTDFDGFIEEVHGGPSCLPECDPLAGRPVAVMVDETTAGIGFALATGARVSGQVTDARTGEALFGASVRLWTPAGLSVDSGDTDSSGHFTLSDDVAPGTYRATAFKSRYIQELYEGIECPLYTCEIDQGTPIEVRGQEEIDGVDFTLTPSGRVGGTVTRSQGEPTRTKVSIFDSTGDYLGGSWSSEETGEYEVDAYRGLTSGDYFVATGATDGLIDEVWNGLTCVAGECDVTAGTPIEVVAGQATEGIDFSLSAGGLIAGNVTAHGGPLPSVAVIRVYAGDGRALEGFLSEDDGSYLTEVGLADGTYFVSASEDGFVNEVFDDLRFATDVDPTRGTPIHVEAPDVTHGVDFLLERGGSIRGSVTSETTGLPVNSYGDVELYLPSGQWAGAHPMHYAHYDSGPNLPAGLYYVKTALGPPYVDEVFPGIPCGEGCDPTIGVPIHVNQGEIVEGINFQLRRISIFEDGFESGDTSDWSLTVP